VHLIRPNAVEGPLLGGGQQPATPALALRGRLDREHQQVGHHTIAIRPSDHRDRPFPSFQADDGRSFGIFEAGRHDFVGREPLAGKGEVDEGTQ
jgi:hypothetical protein